ncbi:MFS transporter [Candidatus Gromoviella agglomerans]|uniref:MFS transporter n=1 Tax=Candidatus Gromoviella agglomerans TaxID=2806609 RepID=UPI001E619EB9|nr:MFS transporter [Candidatus Gromoviella agglomerans]UFX98470.1 Muropeptide transporter [Candidatus Gromoviella agglomerans]
MPEAIANFHALFKKLILCFTSIFSFFQYILPVLSNKRMQFVAIMNFVGVIPYYLTGSTLMIWMVEEGFSISSITLLSVLNTPHAFKFLWAHLFDSIEIPFLSRKLGLRRSWLILCSFVTISCLLLLTLIDVNNSRLMFFTVIFCANFFIASYNILSLAVQMEIIDKNMWGNSEAMNVLGFRIGVIAVSAGALLISEYISWIWVYRIMLMIVIPGIFFICNVNLPEVIRIPVIKQSKSLFKNFRNSIITPLSELFINSNILRIIMFMLFYTLHDHLLGNLHKIFHLSIGFSKMDLAFVDNTFGMFMTLVGGFIAGLSIQKFDFARILCVGSLISLLVGPVLLLQNFVGANIYLLYLSITIQEIVHGFTMTVFFTYQMNCCSIKFAVSQLSVLKAFDALGKYGFGALSGFLVEAIGWNYFFCIISIASIPGFLIIKGMNFMQDNDKIVSD